MAKSYLPPNSFASRVAAAQRPRFKPFKPYQAPPLPSGSYDPALDAQLGAANRGLGDTQADYATQAQRNQIDYGLQQDQINLGKTRGLQDLTTGFNRGNQDLDRSVMLLQRSYSQLQNRQAQDAAAAGVHGGAALQAAAKRAENMAIDRQPLDTQRARLGEDYATGTSRLNEDTSSQLGQLGIGYQRSTDDASTALARAQREGGQFGIDTQAQKAFQAAQSGYEAPAGPKNEFVGPKGNPYRIVRRGGVDYYVRPDGSVAKKRKA
jgi:hypothetical protein